MRLEPPAGQLSQGVSSSAATEWFEFDRLLFDTNSAVLQASSQEQLKYVSEILKAYPKMKVGGDHPVADNSTDAGRQQNRRVALRVTKS